MKFKKKYVEQLTHYAEVQETLKNHNSVKRT
ncbi:hypothetical protein ABIB39_003284 [Mucilaginibacter sp. UYP27]